jgi:hypothetical protein
MEPESSTLTEQKALRMLRKRLWLWRLGLLVLIGAIGSLSALALRRPEAAPNAFRTLPIQRGDLVTTI